MRGSKGLLLIINVVLICSGCQFLWEPSDTEAENLVESYYLFYQSGKEVDAEIIAREKFKRACNCFPIKFRISVPDRTDFNRTFFFFKNETGQIEVSDSEIGIPK